jgi:cytochrome c biogenesis protein CcmG/thiol:disulfide interchange protein DsbE
MGPRAKRNPGLLELAAGLIAAAFAGLAGCGSSAEQAPELNLTALSGKPIRLADYRGQVVLLDFWATWCSPCRMEVPHLVDLQDQYGSRGFQVIGIAVGDNEANVRLFSERMGVNYVTAMGNQQVVEAYGGFTAIPTSFMIAPDGSISARYTGYQEKQVFVDEIEKLLPSVRAAKSG